MLARNEMAHAATPPPDRRCVGSLSQSRWNVTRRSWLKQGMLGKSLAGAVEGDSVSA